MLEQKAAVYYVATEFLFACTGKVAVMMSLEVARRWREDRVFFLQGAMSESETETWERNVSLSVNIEGALPSSQERRDASSSLQWRSK